MTVDEAVMTRLLALPAVTAITGTRLWMVKLPDRPIYPAGRIAFISEERPFAQRGPINGGQWARVQVDLYIDVATAQAAHVNPYTQLSALSEAVDGDGLGPSASGLLGWIGAVGSPPFRVRGIFRAAEYPVRWDADELQVLTRTHDYYVHWAA